jgi:hypothetical protein
MKKLLCSDRELDELIGIMQVSLQEIQTAIDQSHDTEEIDAYRLHRRAVQKWLKLFQQLKASEVSR